MAFLFMAIRLGKGALYTAFSIQLITANLFVTKEVSLFGLSVTPTDVFTIGSLFTLTAVIEHYGKAAARRAIWIGFFFLLFFGVMSEVHLLYLPSHFDTKHDAFKAILGVTPRIVVVSFIAALLSDRCDIGLYAFLKKKLALPLAFVIAALISQFLDTAIFTYGGLRGEMHNLSNIFFFSYFVKCASIALIAPFTFLITKWKPREV